MSDPINPNEVMPTVTIGETPAAVPDASAAALAALGRVNDATMANLTPDQRAAVTKIGGADPVRISDALAALAPTWVQPRQTAVLSNAPPPVSHAASKAVDPIELYREIREHNPVVAARYAMVNGLLR